MTEKPNFKLVTTNQEAAEAAVRSMSPTLQEASQVFQMLQERMAKKIAQKNAKPGTIGVRWEDGVGVLDSVSVNTVKVLIKLFADIMGLSEFVMLCAKMFGYQVGIGMANGVELPDDFMESATQIFEAGARITAAVIENAANADVMSVVPDPPTPNDSTKH